MAGVHSRSRRRGRRVAALGAHIAGDNAGDWIHERQGAGGLTGVRKMKNAKEWSEEPRARATVCNRSYLDLRRQDIRLRGECA